MEALRVLIRRHLVGAWRHRWIGVVFAWLICGAGWLFVLTVPNQYEASARLYVDADAVLTPLLRGLAVDNTVSNQLDILQRTLLSRPNLENLVSKTDLELSVNSPVDLERLVTSLSTDIKINPQTRSLFTITYRSTNAKLSYDVVQAILTIFIESKTGTNRSDMENARLFLQQQIDIYERQLREAEKRRADYRLKYVDLLPAVENGASRLDSAQVEVRTAQSQLQDAIARRDSLAQRLAAEPPTTVSEVDTSTVAAMTAGNPRVADAQRRLDDLKLRFTDKHPDVVAAQRMLDSLRAEAAGETQVAAVPGKPGARGRVEPNKVYEQIKVSLVDNDATIASLQRRLDEATRERDRLEAIARSAPGLQAEYQNMNRDYDVVRHNYEELLSRRESMRIATAAEADADKVKLQIVDPPVVPQIPVAPRRALMLSGVLAAGLLGGLGLAVLLVQFDRSFHSIEDLRELGLPVIGGISLIAASISFRRRLVGTVTFAFSVVALCALFGSLLYRITRALPTMT